MPSFRARGGRRERKREAMFSLGTTEILVILVVALLVIGPSKLPDVARTLGKGMAEFRRMSSDVKKTVDLEPKLSDMGRREGDETGETAIGQGEDRDGDSIGEAPSSSEADSSRASEDATGADSADTGSSRRADADDDSDKGSRA